jgi:hypothetical protein
MSGSTSFGKKGSAGIDPTAVADLSPVSSSDEIVVPTKTSTSGDKQKKVKKATKDKPKEVAKGKAKPETDTTGSQVSPLPLIQRQFYH